MSLAVFSKFEGPDFAAFAVCGLIGYFVGSLAPAGSAVAIFASVLISYHLFLGWLLLSSRSGEKEAGVSLPIGQTILTHAACLVVVLGPVAALRQATSHVGEIQYGAMVGMAATDHSIRGFQAICCGIAGLALFERSWLFSNEAPVAKYKPADVPVAPIVLASTADDFEAWHRHLAQQKPGPRPLGTSLKTEYEQWLLARQQSRQAQASDDGRASG